MRVNHARPDRSRRLESGGFDADTDFADECEAFLAGRWAEERDNPDRPLPVWAWLNPIAHGDLDQVRAAAATVDAPQGVQQLQSVVAKAVLNAIPANELARVQRELLVPLELGMMNAPTSPRRLLELVTSALY